MKEQKDKDGWRDEKLRRKRIEEEREKREKREEGGFLTSGSQPKNPRNSKAELKRFGGESRVHGFWMGGGKLSICCMI